MIKITRIDVELTEEEFNAISNCEDFKKTIKGFVTGDDISINYEIIIASSLKEGLFKINIKDTEDDTYTIRGELNSLLYTPLMYINYTTNIKLLVSVKIPKYRERFHLNQCKLRTNHSYNGLLGNMYVYSSILYNDFANNEDFCETLFLYLNSNHDKDMKNINSLLKEKLEYYGYTIDNFLDFKDDFKDESMWFIFEKALNVLYYNNLSIDKEELRTKYNRFQHNRIIERFPKK